MTLTRPAILTEPPLAVGHFYRQCPLIRGASLDQFAFSHSRGDTPTFCANTRDSAAALA